MRKILLLFLAITPLTITAQGKFKVGNASDLIRAIGSDREIELLEGDYNLSTIIDVPFNQHIEWSEVFDGKEPVLKGINNMKLFSKKGAKIVVEPRYAWVFNMNGCNNISFEGITFGHTVGGSCTGGVLGFFSCKNITIKNCKLYGSGTVGITFEDSDGLTMQNSEIYECTYGLLYLTRAKNVLFNKCMFRNTGEFDLIEIVDCHKVTFNQCEFKDNFNSEVYWETSEFHMFNIDNSWMNPNKSGLPTSTDLTVKKCKFINNKVKHFANDKRFLVKINNKFSGNTFTDYE